MPHTALIIEDEPLISMSLEDLVEEMGFTVVAVATGRAALGAIERQAFSFAVVDYQLSEGTSREAIDQLMSRGVPIILCSGATLDKANLPAVAAFLAKPYAEGELAQAVRRVLLNGQF